MADPRDDVEELVAALYAHIAATEELPLAEEANRRLGEAGAVAGDLAEADVDEETVADRVETVMDLLEEVEETGDADADEHVAAARRAGERVLERL